MNKHFSLLLFLLVANCSCQGSESIVGQLNEVVLRFIGSFEREERNVQIILRRLENERLKSNSDVYGHLLDRIRGDIYTRHSPLQDSLRPFVKKRLRQSQIDQIKRKLKDDRLESLDEDIVRNYEIACLRKKILKTKNMRAKKRLVRKLYTYADRRDKPDRPSVFKKLMIGFSAKSNAISNSQ